MNGIAPGQRQPRLVLCPYGIPHEQRTSCTSLLLHCGGDLNRVIDAPAGEQPFLRHLKRLTGMLEAVRPPIVLLTSATPLMSRVVLLRQRYEAELPSLRRADWVLYLHRDTALFVSEALRRGRLERQATTAIWHGPAGTRFLVTPPGCGRAELEAAMDLLAHGASDPSPSGSRLPIAHRLQLADTERKLG